VKADLVKLYELLDGFVDLKLVKIDGEVV